MKTLVGLLWTLGTVLTPVWAEFQMPRKVHRLAALETARAEAVQQGRPLTFVYTHEKTSCGLAAHASLAAVSALGSKTVVVYVDSGNQEDWGKLPRLVQEALTSPDAGRFIPKTVVVDNGLTQVLATVPYARGEEYDQLLRQAKKTIAAAAAAPSPRDRLLTMTAKPPAAIPEDNTRELRTWTTTKGSQLRASLVTEKHGELILKTETGQLVAIAPAKLSEADQQYVADLKARPAK